MRQVAQPQLDRVDASRLGDLVHVDFAREVIDRAAERAVRAGAERALGGVRRDADVRHVVRRLGAAAADERPVAGVIGVELPGDDRAVALEAALHADEGRGAERGVHHLVGARVGDAHGRAGDPRQAGRLVTPPGTGSCCRSHRRSPARSRARALSSISNSLRQLGADAERALRARPDRQVIALPAARPRRAAPWVRSRRTGRSTSTRARGRRCGTLRRATLPPA